jgi:polysaccharide pyruvyl transferase WcaK-like protein
VSVRDLTTQQALLRLGIEAELSPDSAVVMSRAFERDGIEQQMRVSLRERLQLMSAGGYLAFQIGQPFLRGREKRIAATLTAIAHATGLHIVLLAIGTATGHADQLALARVRAELPDGGRDVLLLADGNVWEIMGTIAGASLYIGTSLHGAITAMSFAVPRLAFTGEVRKLREYLQTWDLPAYASALPIDGAPALVAAALSVGRAEREQLAEQLIDRAERGLHAAIGTPRAADLHHTLLEAAA